MDLIKTIFCNCCRRKRISEECQISIKDKNCSRVTTLIPAAPSKTLQLHGITVMLKKGDITKERVDVIVNSTNNTLDLNSGVSGAILEAAGSSVKDGCKTFGPQANDGVVVTGGGQLQCSHIVHMVGPKTAALITAAVEKTLGICDQLKIATVVFPAIGTGKAGIDSRDSIRAILEGIENYLMNTAANLQTITIVAFDTNVHDCFATIFDEYLKISNENTTDTVLNTSTNQLPTGQNTVIHGLPASWTPMNAQEYMEVALQVGSVEYNKIANEFKISCQNIVVDIIQINRIQNRKLWLCYSAKKQTVDGKYSKAVNERILYHGTTCEIADKVKKLGFNRSFCGRNATYYGKGTYFAKDASYSSDDRFCSPSDQGHKYMFQAKVITGKMCRGRDWMVEPNPVDPQKDPNDLCDCAVNNMSDPTIFVIFCDDGAYPEYLITFKT